MGRFPGPDFWKALLTPGEEKDKRRELSAECWDKAALTYDDLESEPDYARQVRGVVEKMAQKGLFERQNTLLDIACGTGTYAIIFAQRLREVTGIDISGGMLERFRQKVEEKGITNCKIIKGDWSSYDLGEQFDIVFSSMNPLLGSYKDIDRMLDTSKRYLVLVGWAGVRKNLFLEEIGKKILGHPPKSPKSDITVVFGYLYSLGYAPEIEYFHGTWHRRYPLEKQLKRIIWRLEFERDLKEAERQLVREELERIKDKDGLVTLETRVRTGCLVLDKRSQA